jgi:hypothetical protein
MDSLYHILNALIDITDKHIKERNKLLNKYSIVLSDARKSNIRIESNILNSLNKNFKDKIKNYKWIIKKSK